MFSCAARGPCQGVFISLSHIPSCFSEVIFLTLLQDILLF
jgi:hypothetical protein